MSSPGDGAVSISSHMQQDMGVSEAPPVFTLQPRKPQSSLRTLILLCASRAPPMTAKLLRSEAFFSLRIVARSLAPMRT